MASPFSVFRKNQTYWMAALVVIAIISFIIAPALEQIISGSYRAARTNKGRLVSWRGGVITEAYSIRLQQIHGQAQLFLTRLANEVIANGGVPRVPGFEMTGAKEFTLGLNPYNDRLSVIQTKLFAERAKQLGIDISDEAVEQYLVDLTANRVTRQRYAEIFKETSQGNLTHYDLVNYLRDELAARLLLEVFESGVSSQQRPLITPEQNWEIFEKFHKKAKIEAYPVLVDDFMEKAKLDSKPTDEELRTIYNDGKNRIHYSASPLPGFRRRHAANVEFVSADLEQQIKAAVAKLTEEEIVKEYEKGVAAGRYRVEVKKENPSESATGTPTVPAAEGIPPTPGSAPGESNGTTTKPNNTDGKTDPNSPVPDSPVPADENKPVEKPEVPKDGTGGQSQLESNSSLRLVSFQEPAQLESPRPPKLDAPNPPGTTPAPDGTAPTGLTIGEAPASTTTPTAPEMRTQTLEEVREQLTRTMVFETTRLKLMSSLSAIADKMQAYSDENQIYRRSIEAKDTTATKPAELDIKKLADENGLQYGKTGLVDAESVLSLPIGKSMVQNSSFGQIVLTPNLPLFAPGNSQLFDLGGLTTFVFWKFEERPESTPSFDEVRSEVETEWYKQKARIAAREKAEAMAKQLQTVGESPWTAVLSETERALILNPSPFTWMMSGQSSFGMPSITRVEMLDTVGDDFMRRVYSTADGQFTVIPNEPQNRFYVVRVVEKTPGDDELHKLFGLVPNQIDSQSLAQAELQMIRRDWMPQIEKDLDIAWEVSPNDIQ